MNELIEFKSGAKVRYADYPEHRMHSKKTSVDGCIKEATRSPFGNTATTVYDELAVGYHLHLGHSVQNRELVK